MKNPILAIGFIILFNIWVVCFITKYMDGILLGLVLLIGYLTVWMTQLDDPYIFEKTEPTPRPNKQYEFNKIYKTTVFNNEAYCIFKTWTFGSIDPVFHLKDKKSGVTIHEHWIPSHPDSWPIEYDKKSLEYKMLKIREIS